MIDRVISLSKEAGVEPVVVQQNDRQSRTVRFFVLEQSGQPFSVQGRQARILFRKNGATSPAYEAEVHPDGWVSLTVPEAVTKNAGSGEMQLVLCEGDALLHSFTVPFTVKSSLSFVGETEAPADDPMAVNWKNLPGKPAAFPPATHTHTPAQAGALAAGGTAVNAAKLGGKLPESYLRPRNLLGNSCFVPSGGQTEGGGCLPINQREQSEYTGAVYGLDLWAGMSRTKIALTDAGVVLSNLNPAVGQCYWQQLLSNDLFVGVSPDEQYTFAAMIDGTVYTVSGTVGGSTSIAIPNGSLVFLYSAASNAPCCRIVLSSGFTGSFCIQWVALYRGVFNAQTLPPYQPLSAGEELRRCQWYFRRTRAVSNYATIGTGMAFSATEAWINVPRSRMRLDKPTVTVNGTLRIYAGGTSVSTSAITVDKVSDNHIRLKATTTGLTAGTALVATSGESSEFYIDESAVL
jgi:hypothetical protein